MLISLKNNLVYDKKQESTLNPYIDQIDPKTGEKYVAEGTSSVKASLPGSFEIHENGENDIRAIYCALVIADILDILDEELTHGIGDYIVQCQTYEGGLGQCPFGEAHGGYTFCGLAAMVILGEAHKLNLDRMAYWLANRQLTEEGGFNGRTNKLVDSCYNFWQGATFELLDIAMKGQGNVDGRYLCNQEALQGYAIFCCQDEKSGGMKDKPMKRADTYHTMYASSGLSIIQHSSAYDHLHAPNSNKGEGFDGLKPSEKDKEVLLGGIERNRVRRVHPVYNVRYDYVAKAKKYFKDKKLRS